MSTLTVRRSCMLGGGKSYIHSIIYALAGQLKWNWILSRHIDSGRNESPWNKGEVGGLWLYGSDSSLSSQLNDTNFYCLFNVRRMGRENINTDTSTNLKLTSTSGQSTHFQGWQKWRI